MLARGWYILAALIVMVAGTSLLLGRREGLAVPEPHVAARRSAAAADSLVVPGVPEAVTTFLRNGQDWRAARAMRRYLQRSSDTRPEAVLLAARAEAGWGGWDRVREYLEGRPWLDQLRGGEGWYWLGRAREEERDWPGALEAYGRFLSGARAPDDLDRQRVAQLRRGLILLRMGRSDEGSRQLVEVRGHSPDIAGRLDVLAAEALATRGDTAAVRALLREPADDALARRGRSALLAAYQKAGDAAGTRTLALALRGRASNASERAALTVVAARTALAAGDRDAARSELRAALSDAPGSPAAGRAAELLAGLGPLEPQDRLAVARALDRRGSNASAAEHYAAWLASGAGSEAERRQVRLQRGRALFDAGRYPAAISALAPIADQPGALGAQAMLLTGRAEMRRGNAARGRAVLLRLGQRHPRTEQGAEGLFLVADLRHDARDLSSAVRLYAQVANGFPGTDRAGLSLMRLAGIAYQRRDFAGAVRWWEQYRSSYPTGERWLESTYWTARTYQRMGQEERARELFRAVRQREPISYYALRSARRLGEPYWPIPLAASPADDPEARAQVEQWMHGVDLLREAGLHQEAEAEADRLIKQARGSEPVLYALAEALNQRGFTVRGIRIGYDLRKSTPQPNARLLRIIYPFPYRSMLEAEAREKGLDPFLVAALIRQESSFKARIASGVGARGLMQLMPETGRALASSSGIRGYDLELLYQPEINAHLGTRFLADQMRRYDESLPSVFSAYNAGPSRVERWKRFPEAGDEELFTERIPYRETRDYVKILTRNIALYQGLYGGAGGEAPAR